MEINFKSISNVGSTFKGADCSHQINPLVNPNDSVAISPQNTPHEPNGISLPNEPRVESNSCNPQQPKDSTKTANNRSPLFLTMGIEEELGFMEKFTPTNVLPPPGSGNGKNKDVTHLVEIPNFGKAVCKKSLPGNWSSRVQNEYIVYELDKAIGGNIVPETKLLELEEDVKDKDTGRVMEKGIYSAQRYVEDSSTFSAIYGYAYSKDSSPEYVKMNYIDVLIDNQDRNTGNWLVTKNKDLLAIDNGISLRGMRLPKSPYTYIRPDIAGATYESERYGGKEGRINFLKESLEYAKKAKVNLKDEFIETLYAPFRNNEKFKEDYENFGIDTVIQRLKFIRDNLPDFLQKAIEELQKEVK